MKYTITFAIACFSFFNLSHSMEFNTEPNILDTRQINLEQRIAQLEQENVTLKKLALYHYKSISWVEQLLFSMDMKPARLEKFSKSLNGYHKYKCKSNLLLKELSDSLSINTTQPSTSPEKDINSTSISEALKVSKKEFEEGRDKRVIDYIEEDKQFLLKVHEESRKRVEQEKKSASDSDDSDGFEVG